MKLFLKVIIFFTLFSSIKSQSQTIDTLVDVGNHKLHFNIIKGSGIPILFEAGAGSDGRVWNSILKPIADITGATIITYDREGLGKSTINTVDTEDSKHGMLNSLLDLETGLKKLGFNKQIMLVSHSFGGYFSTLYSVRNPNLVKSIVLIDVNHNFMEKFVESDLKKQELLIPEWKKNKLAIYYMAANIRETVKMMSEISIPQNIPVVDLVSGIPSFKETEKVEHWKECHKNFVASHPKSVGITAFECGHGIWFDNPTLVITTIAKSYAETLNEKQKTEVYERTLNYAISSSNNVKKENSAYIHSEDNLNNLGYEYLNKNENEKALEIFKLNALLNPTSGNAYDSYGEILLKINKKEEAIKMYQKSVELNPGNENGKRVLDELLKQS
ncbi:MAG: alpha/beta fold hydrolase [Flavobacterium sp.]|nr:alpha/beta fold hydrolase [Flavobacterium sp.]